MRGRINVKMDKFQEALTSRWSVELHHKLIESAEDGDLMLAFNAGGRLRKKGCPKKKNNKNKTSNRKRQRIQTLLKTSSTKTKQKQAKLLLSGQTASFSLCELDHT